MARVLNVIARPRSEAAQAYRKAIGRPLKPEAIAPGLAPHPEYDLQDHGGSKLAAISFASFYLGPAGAWSATDIQSIDSSLAIAMTDAGLNDILGQYFGGTAPTTTALASQPLDVPLPDPVDKTAVETIVANLLANGTFNAFDLTQTIVNLMLPPGAVLADTGGTQGLQELDESAADSKHGLGGYHGSIHSGGQTVYYAAGVYSQHLPDGTDNGIVAFDQPWKNVVATFYHELNEFRTDADVEDAIRAGNDPTADHFLAWVSPQGYEIGDTPVFESGGDLSLVFKEVPVGDGSKTVPIQLLWSNRVHGPEIPGSGGSGTHSGRHRVRVHPGRRRGHN